MRFISVMAAIMAAIGFALDFGLARGAEPVASWVRVVSKEAGFRADFPSQPQIERSVRTDDGKSYSTTRHAVVANGLAMAVDYSRYADPQTRIDLEEVMRGFADATKGKVTARWETNYKRASDDSLPMLEYTVQSGDMMCRAGAIADGPAVYQVIGCAHKRSTMPSAIERMLSSFALMPRSAS